MIATSTCSTPATRAGLGRLGGIENDMLKDMSEALAHEIFAPSHVIASMLNALRSIDVCALLRVTNEHSSKASST